MPNPVSHFVGPLTEHILEYARQRNLYCKITHDLAAGGFDMLSIDVRPSESDVGTVHLYIFGTYLQWYHHRDDPDCLLPPELKTSFCEGLTTNLADPDSLEQLTRQLGHIYAYFKELP